MLYLRVQISFENYDKPLHKWVLKFTPRNLFLYRETAISKKKIISNDYHLYDIEMACAWRHPENAERSVTNDITQISRIMNQLMFHPSKVLKDETSLRKFL